MLILRVLCRQIGKTVFLLQFSHTEPKIGGQRRTLEAGEYRTDHDALSFRQIEGPRIMVRNGFLDGLPSGRLKQRQHLMCARGNASAMVRGQRQDRWVAHI